jgi:hypothetical protein
MYETSQGMMRFTRELQGAYEQLMKYQTW